MKTSTNSENNTLVQKADEKLVEETPTNPCACEYCGSEYADLVPHPYILEMYNEESLSWLCSECYYQAMMDV